MLGRDKDRGRSHISLRVRGLYKSDRALIRVTVMYEVHIRYLGGKQWAYGPSYIVPFNLSP